MELRELATKAISYLGSRWTLPSHGFLAGGSLANTMWALKNGTEPVVNDIDVFVYVGHMERTDHFDKSSLFRYVEMDVLYTDEYNGIREHPVDKRFYTIKESTNEGMLNTITYEASDEDPMLVIESFDLSCTGVGYDLETGEFYWTEDFENFIETGKITVSNVSTPSHSAIRLVKKGVDLGVGFDEHEMKILMYCIERNMADTLKRYFKQKRMDDYTQVSDIISKYLVAYRCEEVEKMIKMNYNVDDKLYGLMRSDESRPPTDPEDIFDTMISSNPVFADINLDYIVTGKDFLNYMRTVYGDRSRAEAFLYIYPFFNGRNYFDVDPTDDRISLLKWLTQASPMTAAALKDMTLSEQIEAAKRTLDAFEDKTVALALMEKGLVVEPWMDDSDILLLELSHRKELFGRIEKRASKLSELLGGEGV